MTALGVIIIWLLIIEAKVAIDWAQIRKGKSVSHGVEIVGVIFVWIMYGIYVARIKAPNEWAMDVLIFTISSYWLLFDGLLSWHRDFNFFYVSKDPHSAKTDQFFFKNFPLYVGTKIAALALFVASVIWILKDFV